MSEPDERDFCIHGLSAASDCGGCDALGQIDGPVSPPEPTTAPVTAEPRCDKHGPMMLRSPGTREQTFCGAWYLCEHTEYGHACGYTVLLPSPELFAQLDEQRANLAQVQGAKR